MLERLKQTISRFQSPSGKSGGAARPRQRSIDASSFGKRSDVIGLFHEANGEILAATARTASRVNYLYVNNGTVANSVDGHRAECIGTGAVPSSRNQRDQTRIADAWQEWSEETADFHGQTTLEGLQSQVCRSLILDGESLVIIHQDDSGLRLQHIDSNRLDLQKTGLTAGGYIVGGVEFSNAGERIAYWINPHADATPYSFGWKPSVRFPARDVIHCINTMFPQQIRGLSPLARAVLPSSEITALLDAMRQSALMSSLIAGFIRNPIGGKPLEIDQLGDWLPGSLLNIGSSEVDFSNPQTNQSMDKFTQEHMKILANALMGQPLWMVTGDLSGVNYSSCRASLIVYRRKIEQWRAEIFEPQFLNRIWRRWSSAEKLAGNIRDDARISWVWPAFEIIDPQKSVKALVDQLKNGLTDIETARLELHGPRASHVGERLEGNRQIPNDGDVLPLPTGRQINA